MEQNRFSPMELYVRDFIGRVGCISVYEMEYMLYKMYGANRSVVNYMLHRLQGFGILHYDEEGKYVCAGTSWNNKLHRLNRDTIYALSVAFSYMNFADDYRNIYVPNHGENLRFLADNKAYGVLVCEESGASQIAFYEAQYQDYMKKMKKKAKGELLEEIENAYSKLLIVYPPKTDKKSALKLVDTMDLSMPHAVVFIQGDDMYGSLKSEIYNLSK